MTAPVWGCPWHGRVEGGHLTLPNGENRPWPQPDGARRDLYPDNRAMWLTNNAGTTHLVRMPGVPAVERSTEELADDAAAGRTWLNKALLAGASDTAAAKTYLHSKEVDGWIYAAPDGSRWMACALGEYQWTSADGLTIPLEMRRFGVFGAPAASHSYSRTISTAAMGQPSWLSSEERRGKVEAIKPDGSQAIVRLYLDAAQEGTKGFLQLTLSGTPGVDFSASLTALRTAAQTNGTVAVNNAASVSYVELEVSTSESTEDTRAGAPPSCTGYLDTITTYTTDLVPAPSGTGYKVISGTNALTLIGRIMAMWFNAAGEIEEALLDIEKSCTASAPEPEIEYSGRDVLRQSNINGDGVCVLGGATMIEQHAVTRSRSSSQTISALFRLRVGTREVEVSGSQSVSIETSYSATGLPGSRVEVSEKTTDTSGTTFGWFTERHDSVAGGEGTDAVDITTYSAADADFTLNYVPVETGGYNIAFKRWANNLVGLITRRPAGFGVALGTMNWSDALSPGDSLVPGVSETSADTDDTSPWYTYRPYGSFNPLTGEAVIASADPISWT
ncbi:hypothetical protein [Pseudomonas sp. BN515]|uniref:hypothetical protein n=1 Tax=Pseudomonas sp. BN515 TaxID=2567892 RepID=UPI00245603A2|nr:hypothetical protein [Pseudomonas sp. BN515]MDH4873010.1 hypothetical protein [Pseudomonas sp. BN515]